MQSNQSRAYLREQDGHIIKECQGKVLVYLTDLTGLSHRYILFILKLMSVNIFLIEERIFARLEI